MLILKNGSIIKEKPKSNSKPEIEITTKQGICCEIISLCVLFKLIVDFINPAVNNESQKIKSEILLIQNPFFIQFPFFVILLKENFSFM